MNIDLTATMPTPPARNRGFTLVELMVALVAGLIVSGAAVAFMISSMKSNSEYLAGARLGQELRSSMDYVNRELRRAGYDEDALSYMALPSGSTARSPFSTIAITNDNAANSCILYAYDKNAGAFGTVSGADGERHGIRRVVRVVNGVSVGVLETADSDATATAPACDGASPDYSTYPPGCVSGAAGDGWCALSDPRAVNITAFTVHLSPILVDPASGTFGTYMRNISVTLTGTPIRDTAFSQSEYSSIKVRADCLHSTSGSGQCVAAP